MNRDLELEQYFSEAASWDRDRGLPAREDPRDAPGVLAGVSLLLLALALGRCSR